MVGHAHNVAGSLDAVVVGEIEDGILVEFGDHIYFAVAAGGSHMLAEGISVAATGRMRDRGHDFGPIVAVGQPIPGEILP